MRQGLLLLTMALVALRVMGQGDQPADVPYERYRAAFVKSVPDELRALAGEWATAQAPHERYLGMLAMAAAEFREDDFVGCLAALDSLEAHVPATDQVVRVSAVGLRSNAFTMLGDPQRGEQEAEAGLRTIAGTGLVRERVSLMLRRAEGMLMDGRFDPAYDALIEAEDLADSIGFAHGQGGAENAMGLIRLNQRRYEEAWDHFRNALRLANSAGSDMMAQNVVSNMGIVATMTGNYDIALRLCDSLLRVQKSPEFRLSIYNQKGVILRKTGAYDEALACFGRALALKDTLGDIRNLAKTGQHRATVLWEMGRHDEALAALTGALKDAERLKWPELREEAHIELHDWYDSLGRCDDALRHLQAYTTLSDSLHLVRYDEQLAGSEALYGAAKKERRIAEQEQALVLADSETARRALQRNVFIGLAAALVLVALLLWRLARARQRRMRQEQLSHEQQVDDLLRNQELGALNAMFEGQETERDRVARELHDRVGSMLGNVKMQMEVLEERMDIGHTERDGQYRKVYGLLVDTVGEVRRISHDMVAGTLARFGLEKALEDLCDSIRVTGRLSMELRVFGLENRLEPRVEVTVYRIVQELVGNVMKHANATEMSIDVTRPPGRLSVIVSDNGGGFDPSTPSEGMGLANVRQRAATIGGEVTVDSTPGKGTTVSVECVVVE